MLQMCPVTSVNHSICHNNINYSQPLSLKQLQAAQTGINTAKMHQNNGGYYRQYFTSLPRFFRDTLLSVWSVALTTSLSVMGQKYY